MTEQEKCNAVAMELAHKTMDDCHKKHFKTVMDRVVEDFGTLMVEEYVENMKLNVSGGKPDGS